MDGSGKLAGRTVFTEERCGMYVCCMHMFVAGKLQVSDDLKTLICKLIKIESTKDCGIKCGLCHSILCCGICIHYLISLVCLLSELL